MATVHDTAAYILAKAGPMSPVKLQKLCYFSYGYHLAWEGRRLFEERFQAWANGPVAPELHADHRGRQEVADGDIPGDAVALDDSERESVDIVLEHLAAYSPVELSEMTHRQGPWLRARQRAEAEDLEHGREELKDEEIAEFFAKLIKREGEG